MDGQAGMYCRHSERSFAHLDGHQKASAHVGFLPSHLVLSGKWADEGFAILREPRCAPVMRHASFCGLTVLNVSRSIQPLSDYMIDDLIDEMETPGAR